MSKRLGGIDSFTYETSSWHLNGFPDGKILGQQYNVGEKPTVILYTYINRHAQKGRQTNASSNNKDKSNTIIETSTVEDHDDENLHDPSTRPRYSPGSRRRAVCRRSHKEVRGKRKELGSSLHYLSGLRHTDAPHAWT